VPAHYSHHHVRTAILRVNYRNTAQIMAVACEFARDLLSAKEAEEDAIPLVTPQSAGRSGALPELRSFAGEEAELATEAKLLYVAMTRAMDRLHMTHHGRSVFVERLRAAVGASH